VFSECDINNILCSRGFVNIYYYYNRRTEFRSWPVGFIFEVEKLFEFIKIAGTCLFTAYVVIAHEVVRAFACILGVEIKYFILLLLKNLLSSFSEIL